MNKNESEHKYDDFTKPVLRVIVCHRMTFGHVLLPGLTHKLLPLI
jgi:hypothetical protein